MLNPQNTYLALLIVQALHLLHHPCKTSHQLHGSGFGGRALRPAVGSCSGLVANVRSRNTHRGTNRWQRLDQKAVP